MKIDIELTKMQEHYLKLFAKNQYEGAKDNLCTYKPIHAVQTQRSRVAAEGYDYDKIVYVVPDWEHEEYQINTLHEFIEQYYEYQEKECPVQIINYDDAYKLCEIKGVDGEIYAILDVEEQRVEYFYEDVSYFYTLQSAKEYLQYQGHNLTNPRTYTKSGGYDNRGEYEHFWDLLMALGVKLNESEADTNENKNYG
jgi:hypothetical protein